MGAFHITITLYQQYVVSRSAHVVSFDELPTNLIPLFRCLLVLKLRLYRLLRIFDPSVVCEVIAGIPLLTSPFRSQFAWNFQYLRIVRLHYAFSFVSHHPATSLNGRSYQLWSYFFTTVCMMFGAGGFFFVLENKYFNENGQIKDMVDAMYYVVITVSTTGYGDISPKTVLGRIGAILLALAALIYIPIRVAKLVQILQISTSGVVKKPGKHVIVSAYDPSDFETFVKEFFHPDRPWSDTTLALMAPNSEVEAGLHRLVNHPQYELRVQALQGSLSNPAYYPNYYLESCQAVILMADKSKGALGDSQTLVTAMSLMQRYPSLPLYVQVQTQTSKATAIARGINNTMCIEELRLGIILQNTLNPCFAPFVLNLMRTTGGQTNISCPANKWLEEYLHGEGNQCYSDAPLKEFEGQTFGETATYLYKKYGILLFGIVTRTERLIAKKKPSTPDGTEASTTKSTDTSSRTSATSSLVASAMIAGVHHHRRSPSSPQALAAMSFDRDRRNIESGERMSIDLGPGTRATSLDGLLDPRDFELVVDWQVDLNPGPEFVIHEGHEGLVLAQGGDLVQSICCDDIQLLHSIVHEHSTWSDIAADEKDLHLQLFRKSATSSLADADDDAQSSDSEGQPPNHTEATEKTKHKSKADSPKSKGPKALKSSMNEGGQLMVNLSKVDRMRVPLKLKQKYDLVDDYHLDLDKCTLPSVEGVLQDHILITGEWYDDMYNVVLGLRRKELRSYGKLRPLVFLGPEAPPSYLWQKVCMFKDLFCVIGSQLDPADLKRAGAITAYRILVLESGCNQTQDVIKSSRSLTTFLILQKLTKVHATIELLSADSLDLLLKGHDQLYQKKPDSNSEARQDYDAARAAYKELNKLGACANPYYAAGNVMLDSFLDSLISLSYFNQQLLAVLTALCSPTAFQSVSIDELTTVYPYLITAKKKKKKRRRRRSKSRSRKSKDSIISDEGPASMKSESMEMDVVSDPEEPEDYVTEHKEVTFGEIFDHFLKYSGGIVLAIQRVGRINVAPYVITVPDVNLVLAPEDVCYYLAAEKLKPICSFLQMEDTDRMAPGSIIDIPARKGR